MLCGDDVHRFPFPAASVVGRSVEVATALSLLDADERSFYRRHGRLFSTDDELRDAHVSVVVGLVEDGTA